LEEEERVDDKRGGRVEESVPTAVAVASAASTTTVVSIEAVVAMPFAEAGEGDGETLLMTGELKPP
jgi:hypothetical protein